ncbi:polysaccharide pyruvyl transferase family protein [Synechococcus sp. UW140]|uniref:polysaccharide pyruvyl transferase family protein n=1 Tax=Synechococcus sp. UW140 TaxID=368503 RepID=UPI000E0E3200|nr:polysaccharide pyruvyl transferase family protein [Synechococcus sp. UW140]
MKQDLIIEIRKAGFVNKGAELMLLSIINQLKNKYPLSKITCLTTHEGGHFPYSKVSKLGILPKGELYKSGLSFNYLFELLPYQLLKKFGIILASEVDVIIDSAGFAYSSQWGIKETLELYKSVNEAKKNKSCYVLLPQAFGPFHDKRHRNIMRQILEKVDLVFARDSVSYANLIDLQAKKANIVQMPDFTNLLKGKLPMDIDPISLDVCIIPNKRMCDKTNEDKDIYIKLISKIVKYLLACGRSPFFLIHEGEPDLLLAKKIISTSRLVNLPIIQLDDPLSIKGIIANSNLVISSRFHGIVSALSSNVPTLATGWSHKYVCLFDDYSYPQGLLSTQVSDKELYSALDQLISKESAELISKKLEYESSRLRQLSLDMWNQTFETIDQYLNDLR